MRFSIVKAILAAVILVAAGSLLWMNFRPDPGNSPPAKTGAFRPMGQLEQFVYTRTIGGRVQWELAASEAAYYQEDNRLQLQQVNGTMNTPTRRLTLKGERGTVNLNDHTAVLEGSVVGTSDDGYTLYTSRLEFDGEARVVHTDQAVLLEGPTLTLEGIGMDLNLKEERLQLHQNVRSRYTPGGTS